MELHERYFYFADAWRELDVAFTKWFYSDMAKQGLHQGQPKVLRYLLHHDGCKQKDLSDAFKIRAASVSGSLDKLEQAGLVQRVRNKASRREVLIYLTDKGREKAQWVYDYYWAQSEFLFSKFSDEEFDRFMDYFARLVKTLEK